jgi:hypothetical protein
MLVPIPIRSVRAAIAAAATSDEGSIPSSVKWCSDSHTDSNPSRSASLISTRHCA